MKKNTLILVLTISLFTGSVFAQDVKTIFNGSLTYDAAMSGKTKATTGMIKALFDELNGDLDTRVYRFTGSFEEAINNVMAPSDANVSGVSEQPFAGALNMFVMMTENFDPKPMGNDWYEKVNEKAAELGDQTGKSWTMTIGESALENPANLKLGSKVSVRTITVASPFFDMDNFLLVDGTWVTEMIATIVVTEELLAESSGGFEEEWDEEEMDMDIELPSDSHFVSFNDVANTEMMQGDANYVVEMSADQVISFYKNYKKRHCTIEEQSSMFGDDDKEIMITYMVCLTHEGEVETGDDVVHLTIIEAPKDLLSDALGRNQGIWTLISINRWVEENN
ncbi:hypothetical protein ACFLRW_03390 [Acidobacteriota bacterium]